MHDSCHQINHVENFTVYRLTPKQLLQACELYDMDEELEVGLDGETLADGLSVGDNVAIWAPFQDEPFWLMLVVKDVHAVEEAFTDPDGNNYVPADVVFSVLWYERLREGSRTYLLRNDRESHTIYS